MKKPDIFDPSKRYAFSNWSDEDFTYKYANPDWQFVPPSSDEYTQKEIKRMYEAAFKKDYYKTITIPKGGVIEVPEWLAFLLCKHFVDREYIKATERKYGSLSITKNNGEKNEKAESEILNMASPNAREEMENATIRLINADEESPVIAALREQIRKEERAKLAKRAQKELEVEAMEHVAKTIETTKASSEEFADANKV